MSFFRFKNFTIFQDHAAMKVSTDACIQGATFVQWLQRNNLSLAKLLDIGAGTGLLSLMLADAFPTLDITAVEMNELALIDLKHNIEVNNFHKQISVIDLPIQAVPFNSQYDYIICNPPFFNNQLKTTQSDRRLARHDDMLTKELLAASINENITDIGYACVMYPASEWEAWTEAVTSEKLQLIHQINIFPHEMKPCNRIIGIYSKFSHTSPTEMQFTIYNTDRTYTAQFIECLQSYYLYL